MSNEHDPSWNAETQDRPIRLPGDGRLWKIWFMAVLAAGAAAGAASFGLLNDLGQSGSAPSPKPQVITPGVQAPAPAPIQQAPTGQTEPAKVQERIEGGEPPPSAPFQPSRPAPLPPGAETTNGARPIPLAPRPVQVQPVIAPTPLADEPPAAGSAPAAAPLPKARPRG